MNRLSPLVILRSLEKKIVGASFALIALGVFGLAPDPAQALSPSSPRPEIVERQATSIVASRDLPQEARDTLAKIHSGGPFPYPKDGVVFGNHEGRLPKMRYGYYTEYTVKTPGAHDRGARRIIAGAGPNRNPRTSGEYYYTDDHYGSFKKIVER